MPRIRADDYLEKRDNILDLASALFADHGYMGTKMEQIAESCGVSKSMLYHYFKKKEDILFAILQSHVTRLIKLVEAQLRDEVNLSNEEFFRHFVQLWLEPSDEVRSRHVVGMVEVRHLTPRQKAKQVKLEKTLLDLVTNVLVKINGRVGPGERRIYSLLLIGMMNWVELWYKRAGSVSPAELYTMVGRLFLDGFLNVVGEKAKHSAT
ncbi:TetR/AcrR family transcriptional regulator [Rhodoferax sp.]|uniref:TetR/AcrR family transcriptional regulator n=1 Tax=Rhodoferax sp. TaxID=50421 RepID=UPI002622DD89|nr:TetR/AcrR family transcriptional regulator [Rhodoferax sp.]MDD2919646.1 TetR/AcrR family transcriptional regulator [Rhodoferax sp.]